MMGGGEPQQFREMAAQVQAAWSEHQRPGRPRTAALAFFCLGSRARETADSFLGHYYDFPPDAGDRALIDAAGASSLAEVIVQDTAMTAEAVRNLADEWAAVGCDELILLPCSGDPGQVDLLADALGTRLPVSRHAHATARQG